jgi:hypothetical protein
MLAITFHQFSLTSAVEWLDNASKISFDAFVNTNGKIIVLARIAVICVLILLIIFIALVLRVNFTEVPNTVHINTFS